MIKLGNFIVLLDACVLFKAPVRDLLLRLAELELYQLRWSEKILNEVSKNLIEDRQIPIEKSNYLITCMKDAFPEAMVESYEDFIPTMKNHPDDRHVLAAAVFTRAQVIVTDNIKDFPQETVKLYNIEIQTTDAFLMNLLDLSPSSVMQAFKQQVKDLKNPPMTEKELLDKLSTSVPKFIKELSELLITNFSTLQ